MNKKDQGTDLNAFVRLVALLDSAQDREAEGAFYRIRELLKRDGKRLCDVMNSREYRQAVQEVFGGEEGFKVEDVPHAVELARLSTQHPGWQWIVAVAALSLAIASMFR